MLLVLDVRNGHTVVGAFRGTGNHSALVHRWRIRTDPYGTADDLALRVKMLIGDDARTLTGIAALSTVPSVLAELRVMMSVHWPTIPHVVVEPGVRTGVPLLVDNPKEVGADRIVNALSAFGRFAKSAVVVDFGSSICVDVVSAKGEFLGGAIAPGVEVSADASASRSAALRKVELVRPRSVVGKNTVECMQAGAIFGFAGMVDGLVARMRAEVPGFNAPDVVVVATGDTAPIIVAQATSFTHHEPNLTLDGLRRVFERNAS